MILNGAETDALPTNLPPPAFSMSNVLVTVVPPLTKPKSRTIGVTITTGLVNRFDPCARPKEIKINIAITPPIVRFMKCHISV